MYQSLRKVARRAYYSLHQAFFSLAGGKVRCNVCGFRANRFADDGWHKNSICQGCGSSIRQRLLWQMLEEHATLNKFDLLTDKSVLHFAPEPVLRDKIKKLAGNYVTADYFALGYHYPDIDLNLDIAAMPSIKSESIDCLIACDVLEHVADDQKALLEINRVLSKGGVCLITVPQRDGFDKTETDLSPMTPEQREKRFGQFDHYRIYGSDFVEQMSQAGFHVQVVDEKHFSNEVVERHVLFPPELSKHPLATNFRKVFVGIKH